MIPELPPPPPPPEAAPSGPRDLPAVVWGFWQALAVFVAGDLLIGQLVVGSIVLSAI